MNVNEFMKQLEHIEKNYEQNHGKNFLDKNIYIEYETHNGEIKMCDIYHVDRNMCGHIVIRPLSHKI